MQLSYHIVWATDGRQPLITDDIATRVYELIRVKAVGLKAKVFALGGMPDHVHLVAAIPPSIALADFVGQVKGASSAHFNREDYDTLLRWQQDYAVFSFSGQHLPRVLAYVEQQQRHHANDTLLPLLERCGEARWDALRERSATYQTAEDWLTEVELPLEQDIESPSGGVVS